MISATGIAHAQYIPAYKPDSLENSIADVIYWHEGNMFKHLEISLTAGTTGIGLDVATPINEYFQVRFGYDYMPRFKKRFKFNVNGDGKPPVKYDANKNRVETPFDKIANYFYEKEGRNLENQVTLLGKSTMNNLKLLVDIYPIKYNTNFHITAGVYWGPSEVGTMYQSDDSEQMMKDIVSYNKMYRAASEGDKIKGYGILSIDMGTYSHNFQQGDKQRLLNGNYQMEPTDEGNVEISVTSNSIKPYLGFGYGGRLIPNRNDWKVTVECGALIWGGTPSQTTHDGTDLSGDVKDYPHSITKIIKALKVYPVLSVRFAKTLF